MAEAEAAAAAAAAAAAGPVAARTPVLMRIGTPLAKPVDVHAAFKGTHVADQALENLRLLTSHRERVVAVLKGLDGHDDVAPRPLMQALDEYLPYVGTVCTQLLAAERVKYRVQFPWTSVLSRQPPRKTKEVVLQTYSTFEEECATAFATYGIAHMQAAEELLRSAGPKGGAAAAALIGAGLAGADDPFKEAASLLRRGAGVFLWLVQVMLPRLALPRGGPKDSAPELWPAALSALYHGALAGVQEVAIAQAARRGTGAGLLGKLHLGASEKYLAALKVIKKANAAPALNDEVVIFLTFKHHLHGLLAHTQLARQAEADEKWGLAVALLKAGTAAHALRLRVPRGMPNPGLAALAPVCADAVAEAASELRRIKNDNDRVYYQSEPSKLEVPKGVLLQTAREEPYTPPAELEAVFFATDPDKKGSCLVS